MLIPDLMAALAAMYPNQFAKQATLDAWAKEYRRLLFNFQGAALQKAWDATMDQWNKATFPRPADIRKHCRQETPNDGTNHKNLCDYVKQRCPELVEDAMQELWSQFGDEPWLVHCKWELKILCGMYAQYEWYDSQGEVQDMTKHRRHLTYEEISAARAAWETQERDAERRGSGTTFQRLGEVDALRRVAKETKNQQSGEHSG